MITVNKKQYRNQTEQILKNKEDIQDFTSINGLLGIKIVGVVTEDSPLPAEDSEEFAALEYGDAYIEDNGTDEDATDYTFYVKTRPNIDKDYDHWFELRLTGIQGPRGLTGPQGEQGIDGTYWYVTTSQPANPRVNDIYLNPTTGTIYVYNGSAWQTSGNIKGATGNTGAQGPQGPAGPTGPQGPQGVRGDPGAFVHIVGMLNSESLLPDPSDVRDLSAAYLVKQASPGTGYDLYIQIGQTIDTAQWNNVGELNAGTYVTVEGEFQGMWNADTKLDKRSEPLSSTTRLYGYKGSIQDVYNLSTNSTANSVVQRTAEGRIWASTPVESSAYGSDKQVLNIDWWHSNASKVVRLG